MTERQLGSFSLLIPGAPRTKKNHGSVIQRGGRRFHIPSGAWLAWRDAVHAENLKLPLRDRYPQLASRSYNCAAVFYRDAARGDAVGYYQGLADLLEYLGVVPNDRYIVSWDGSHC